MCPLSNTSTQRADRPLIDPSAAKSSSSSSLEIPPIYSSSLLASCEIIHPSVLSRMTAAEDKELLEQAAAAAPIEALTAIPLFHDFYRNHGASYERIHIHLLGISSTAVGGHDGETKRTNHNDGVVGFDGCLPRRRWTTDAVPDPYVTVRIVGGGDTTLLPHPYFPIDQHQFATLWNCVTPVWDAKCLLLNHKKNNPDRWFGICHLG
jgi:hypothetical protein